MKNLKRNAQAQQIVWDFLLNSSGEKLYLTQISQRTKISDSTVHQILEKKVKEKLLKKEKLGNLSLYFVDKENPVIKQQKILKSIQFIQPLVNQLKTVSQKIVMYGSCALGENTAASDLDLFILSNQKDQVYKVFSQAKNKNKVSLLVKNFLELMQLKNNDKLFFGQIEKGKVLWETNDSI